MPKLDPDVCRKTSANLLRLLRSSNVRARMTTTALNPYIVAMGIWFVIFLQFVTSHRVIPFDSLEAFYETVYFNSHALRHGLSPWWNPYVYSGYPQVADPQGMLFSPVMMAMMIAVEAPSIFWFDLCVLVHVLLGGLGFIAFCRAYRVSAMAALLGTIVYFAGGAASARLEHTPQILAYAYFPWVLLCLRRVVDRPRAANGVLLGLAAGAMLTQLVQPTYLFVLFAIAYAGVRLSSRGASLTRLALRELVIALVCAAGIATLIAGWQVAATLAVLPLSTRGSFSLDAVRALSLTPRAFLTLVWPNVFGTLDGEYSGVADPTESFLYIGTVPLVVLLLFLPRALTRSGERADRWLFLAGAVFACLYTLGPNAILYAALYKWLPGVDLFRRPSDASFLFNFCVAVLTAFAAAQALERFMRDGKRREAAIVFALAAATYGAIAVLEDAKGTKAWPVAALSLVALVAAGVSLRAKRSRRGFAVGLVAIAILDVRVFALPNRLNAAPSDVAHFFDAPGSIVRTLKGDQANDPDRLPFRVEVAQTKNLWAGGLPIHGLSGTQGYNPMRLRDYANVFGAQESSIVPRPFTAAMPSLDSPLFDLAGARYVVTSVPLGELSAGNAHRRFEYVMSEDGLTLWRNRYARERILTPTQAVVVPPGQVPTAQQFDGIDFDRTVLLYPHDARSAEEAARSADRCHARSLLQHVAFDNVTVQIDVTAAEDAWLVLSDLYFPGWRASIDGVSAPMWKANALYRAVCVPPGAHRVRFEFHPLELVRERLLD